MLLAGDPEYVNRLSMVGSSQLVRAWLDGDWNAIEGAFFDDWDERKHVLEPFAIPTDWLRFRSMDWGSARPFSVGWWAVAGDDMPIPGNYGLLGDPLGLSAGIMPRHIRRGALVRYREWYGARSPNVGLKLTAEQVGDGIALREKGEKIDYGVLDPAAFSEDGGPSIAERMAARKVYFRRADNARVASRGAMGGWDQMRSRMRGDGESPMLYVFSTCKDFIRTVPTLQHDQSRAEDLDTEAEDHIADEVRYACMSRPWVRISKSTDEANAVGFSRMSKNASPKSFKTY